MLKKPFIATRELVVFPGVVTPIFIGRQASLSSLEEALSSFDNKLILSTQKDPNVEEPKLPEDVYETGVLVHVIQTVKMPNSNVKVLVEAKHRVLIGEFEEKKGVQYADYEEIFPKPIDESKSEALKRRVIDEFSNYAKITQKILPDVIYNIKEVRNIDKAFDLICTNLMIATNVKQELLEILDVEERAYKILSILEKEVEIFTLEREIENKVKEQMAEVQKNYYLREKIKAMREEMGEDSDSDEELEELDQRVQDSKIPKELKAKMVKELSRLKKMPDFSAEASVIRSYVETVLELPWDKSTKDEIDIEKAEKILDEDHYGLEEVKARILEFLAVKKLNNTLKGSIICLVGPPGVGKTSLANSVARSMNRKFTRISLGGLRDEAEIRGHRRTYIGSMPGRIINSLKQVGVNNPVMLFDEIDKMASDIKGDPAAAMLEVIDPAQNNEFVDHYLDIPFDLSKVLFIATANNLSLIPAPLRDRMEVIELESYTIKEKENIAAKYLIPRQIKENGLKKGQITFSKQAINKIINGYTYEAGVRNLERVFGAICRKAALKVLQGKEKIKVGVNNLEDFAGPEKYSAKDKNVKPEIGLVNGLAYTVVGGDTLEIETSISKGTGKIILTGKLGDVMKESAQMAISFLRSNAEKLGIEGVNFSEIDIHLHVPEGAVPKDGPSAGITITTSVYSALTKKPVDNNIAMTGEMTLHGKVLPIGGVKEKILSSEKMNINTIIIPTKNKKDLIDIPEEVLEKLTIHTVDNIQEVFKIVFGE